VLTMRDATGRQLWRRPVWNARIAVFSADGRRVVAATRGGLIELDAHTGERIAVACGYEFGLHDAPPRAMPANVPTACED